MALATLMTNAHYSVFFKQRFPQRKIEDLVAYGKPFLSQCMKSDELVGSKTNVPLSFDSPQGMSAALTTAIANATSTRGINWVIEPEAYYAALTIDAKTMLASRNNEGAFFRSREREMENILEQMGQVFEMSLWQTGSGSLGQLLADPGTGTNFTLKDAADAIKFHVGMKVNFYADSGGALGTVRAGGTRTISAVNEDTGVIEVTAALDAALALDDHVVREGDNNNYVVGVPGWIPATAPAVGGGDSHFGVDRSVAPQKLAGHRQSWLGSIEETAKRLDSKIRRINQKPKQLWLSYENFNRLDLELGARGYRDEDKGEGSFGRKRLMMTTPGGGVEVKTAPYLGNTVGFLLEPSSWKICTLGPLPHVVEDDGLTAIRITNGTGNAAEDGIEIRLRAFWQLVCVNPYANGRITIS
jgi:hypothetical protein